MSLDTPVAPTTAPPPPPPPPPPPVILCPNERDHHITLHQWTHHHNSNPNSPNYSSNHHHSGSSIGGPGPPPSTFVFRVREQPSSAALAQHIRVSSVASTLRMRPTTHTHTARAEAPVLLLVVEQRAKRRQGEDILSMGARPPPNTNTNTNPSTNPNPARPKKGDAWSGGTEEHGTSPWGDCVHLSCGQWYGVRSRAWGRPLPKGWVQLAWEFAPWELSVFNRRGQLLHVNHRLHHTIEIPKDVYTGGDHLLQLALPDQEASRWQEAMHRLGTGRCHDLVFEGQLTRAKFPYDVFPLHLYRDPGVDFIIGHPHLEIDCRSYLREVGHQRHHHHHHLPYSQLRESSFAQAQTMLEEQDSFSTEDEEFLIRELLPHCTTPMLTICSNAPWIIIQGNPQAEVQFLLMSSSLASPPLESLGLDPEQEAVLSNASTSDLNRSPLWSVIQPCPTSEGKVRALIEECLHCVASGRHPWAMFYDVPLVPVKTAAFLHGVGVPECSSHFNILVEAILPPGTSSAVCRPALMLNLHFLPCS